MDHFAGSDSTLTAAAVLGRKYIGFDIDEKYAELGQKRIEDTLSSGLSEIDDKEESGSIGQPKNLIQNKTITTTFPGIYAIIADAVDTKNQIDMPVVKRKRIVMQFSNDVYTYLDPHFDNFIFHKDPTGRQPYKIIIVDTEHFPSITGFEKAKYFKNHHNWYMNLARKCFSDMYFKTKRELRFARTLKSPLCLDDPIFEIAQFDFTKEH